MQLGSSLNAVDVITLQGTLDDEQDALADKEWVCAP